MFTIQSNQIYYYSWMKMSTLINTQIISLSYLFSSNDPQTRQYSYQKQATIFYRMEELLCLNVNIIQNFSIDKSITKRKHEARHIFNIKWRNPTFP